MQYKKFSEIDINDTFFDSLKSDYEEFEDWYLRKSNRGHSAFVMDENGKVEAFLYLKAENEESIDIQPPLPKKLRLKVGTFKINPHGTRLGEKFIKKIFDCGIEKK